MVSATEWIDSASIDEAPVIRKPTNFAIAMPRLARAAARMAFLLPSCTRPLSRSQANPQDYMWSSSGCSSPVEKRSADSSRARGKVSKAPVSMSSARHRAAAHDCITPRPENEWIS